MKEQLEARLAELERDFELGHKQLQELEVRQAQLRETLLRIDGAVRVLRELLGAQDGALVTDTLDALVPAASTTNRDAADPLSLVPDRATT